LIHFPDAGEGRRKTKNLRASAKASNGPFESRAKKI
jgi:hypothetical protein